MSASMKSDFTVAIVTATAFSVGYLVLIFGFTPTPTMPNSGVADLEKALIDVNGILLGFAGIVFAQLLAGGQSLRSAGGGQSQRTLSNLLLRLPVRGVLLVVTYFSFSIVISISVLAWADGSPNSTTKVADAVVLPLLSMILALSLLLLYIVRYGRTQFSLIQAGP